MHRVIIPVATALGVVAALVGGVATAQNTISIPSNIPADCSADVSADLATFLNSVHDDSVVIFATGGCYRVERQMDLDRLVNVTLDGRGATLRRTEPTPLAMRYPKANGFLRLLAWQGGGVRNLNIQGINARSDKDALGSDYGAWNQSMEFDAGINVRGGAGLTFSGLRIDGTYGDGIQIQRWHGDPTNITVRDVVIGHNGRQGISISAANGVLIDRVTILGSRRGGIDIEPAGVTMVAQNIEIRNSTIASWLLAFPSQGNGLANHVHIHDNTITRTGVPFVKVYSTAGLRRTNWRVANNTVTYGLGSPQPAMIFDNVTNVLVDGNVLRLKDRRSQLAVGLRNGATARISNNWFKGALAHPQYVDARSGTSWVGGNNSVTADPPSSMPWPPPTTAPLIRRKTSLSLNVPEPAEQGKALRARGRLFRATDSSSRFLDYSGQTVRVQFRKTGTTTYRTILNTRTNADGGFHTGSRIVARDSGQWRAVFQGNPRHGPSASRPDFVKVQRKTKLTFNVREPAMAKRVLHMRGRLLRSTGAPAFAGFPDRSVRIQFRAEGAAKFATVLIVRTSSNGTFVTGREVKARRSGTWRAVFPGGPNHLAAKSARDVVELTRR
ncbi:MAG: right-handed parallel beta-helix repeat-containing protein [Actinomycetes bacterium]